MGPYQLSLVREAVVSLGEHVVSGTPVASFVVYRYIDFTKSKQLPASSRRWEGPSCEEAVVEALSTLGRGPLSGGLLKKITKFCQGCLLPCPRQNPSQPLPV